MITNNITMKNLILPIMLLFGMSNLASAQDTTAREKRANKDMFSYSYDKVINSLEGRDDLTVDGQRSLAVSYHKMNQNLKSDSVYKTFINGSTGVVPEDYFNYAMVLKMNGNYEQSVVWMDKFSSAKPNDLRAKDYQANKLEYANWLVQNKRHLITRQSINSEGSEFGPSYYKDRVVFASSRPTSKVFEREDNWHNLPYLDLYISTVKNEQLEKPEYFNSDLNGKYNDGPASFNKEGTFIAFTRNNHRDKSKDRVVELQIMFSKFANDKWSEPEPFYLNDPAYSIGHPALSADGNTMYFTSDIPGGFGGGDLYKVTRNKDGEWSKPINLGNQINTEGDEAFPFFEANSQKLLFSSDGRYGIGGLDIFVAEFNGPAVVKVYNAGFPINTQFDDFSAITDATFTTGYFATSRGGSDDIYSLTIIPADFNKKLNGLALEKKGKPLANTMVTLYHDKVGAIDSSLTAADGAYSFNVNTNTQYRLTGTKATYTYGSNTASTFGSDSIVYANVILSKIYSPEPIKVEPKSDLAEVVELNTIYFDLDKHNLRSDAKIELDKVVKVMNNNPELIIALRSHTDCRASEKYNQLLSDRRAKSTVNYIRARITKPSRISGKGYGEALSRDCPCGGDAITDCSEDQYQLGRNTEFTIVNGGVIANK